MNLKFPLHSYQKYNHVQIQKTIHIFRNSTSVNRFTVDASAASIHNCPHMKQNTISKIWLHQTISLW